MNGVISCSYKKGILMGSCMTRRCAGSCWELGVYLGGELALDGVAVAHRQRRLVVGQLLEAGEAVVPVGRVVGAPSVATIACGSQHTFMI